MTLAVVVGGATVTIARGGAHVGAVLADLARDAARHGHAVRRDGDRVTVTDSRGAPVARYLIKR